MQHHEPQISDEMAEMLRHVNMPPLGPTGAFPDGKLTENDEGELRIGITSHKGSVVLNFGKPVQSIGMTPKQARGLIRLLSKCALEASRNKPGR